MAKTQKTAALLNKVIQERLDEILKAWGEVLAATDVMAQQDPDEAARLCREFIEALAGGLAVADDAALSDHEASAWEGVRATIDAFAEQRVRQGFSAIETALFLFSLKQPLISALQTSIQEPTRLAHAIEGTNEILARLGLYAMQVFVDTREAVIRAQEKEMLEMSTPVVTLWEGILALPLIGTLDSERTQVVMERLLNRIVENRATIAIIDITGVPTIDTLTAQHLLKTVAAAKLMGAECIISGIRPQIAQTMVHLGIDLGGVMTKASLAGALQLALNRRGFTIRKA